MVTKIKETTNLPINFTTPVKPTQNKIALLGNNQLSNSKEGGCCIIECIKAIFKKIAECIKCLFCCKTITIKNDETSNEQSTNSTSVTKPVTIPSPTILQATTKKPDQDPSTTNAKSASITKPSPEKTDLKPSQSDDTKAATVFANTVKATSTQAATSASVSVEVKKPVVEVPTVMQIFSSAARTLPQPTFANDVEKQLWEIATTQAYAERTDEAFSSAKKIIDKITDPQKKFDAFYLFTNAVTTLAFAVLKSDLAKRIDPKDELEVAKKVGAQIDQLFGKCLALSDETIGKLSAAEKEKIKAPALPPKSYLSKPPIELDLHNRLYGDLRNYAEWADRFSMCYLSHLYLFSKTLGKDGKMHECFEKLSPLRVKETIDEMDEKFPIEKKEPPVSYEKEEKQLMALVDQASSKLDASFASAKDLLDKIKDPAKKYEAFRNFTTQILEKIYATLKHKPAKAEALNAIELLTFSKAEGAKATAIMRKCVELSDATIGKFTREQNSGLVGDPTVPPKHYIHNKLRWGIVDLKLDVKDKYFQGVYLELSSFVANSLQTYLTPDFKKFF